MSELPVLIPVRILKIHSQNENRMIVNPEHALSVNITLKG